jgi:hypothetical protein
MRQKFCIIGKNPEMLEFKHSLNYPDLGTPPFN